MGLSSGHFAHGVTGGVCLATEIHLRMHKCGGVKDVQPDTGEWEVSSCSMLVQRYTGVAQIACQIGTPRGRAHCMKLREKCLDSFRTAHALVSSAPHCFRTYLRMFSPGPGAMQRQ